jgi:TctA family transporter
VQSSFIFVCYLDVPIVPIVLGILLGDEMEVNLRRAMTISDGDWSILVGSPLAIILWAIAITGLASIDYRAPCEKAYGLRDRECRFDGQRC